MSENETPTIDLQSEEGLISFAKLIAEGARSAIVDNNLKADFTWWDVESGTPLLVAMPATMEHEHRNELARGILMLGSAVPDDVPLVFMSDTYVSRTKLKKNGEPWGPGEMENAYLFQTEDFDSVAESLNINVAINGWLSLIAVTYIRTPQGVDFNWDEASVLMETPEDPRAGMGGYFPDVMRAATGGERLVDMIAKEGVSSDQFGLSERDAQIHMFCALTKMISSMNLPVHVGIPCFSEEEAGIVSRSFGGKVDMYGPETKD